jgi:uncharacterized protein YbgA (DUF1722 family)/uncharacterized protein YbbK (DUF523 family)
MRDFAKPIIYVSKCLGFDNCRYNGLTISSEFTETAKGRVKFAVVCPEVEIGLGVPRYPIRLVSRDGELRLLQSVTSEDVTERMRAYIDALFSGFTVADGFILKSRSPSCGISGVKVYPGLGRVQALGKTAGFFGGAVINRLPRIAVEDEGRITNFRIREHFLTRVFALAQFRGTKESLEMKGLVEFHSRHKFLLMSYNQREMRSLGRTVANHERLPPREVFRLYEERLYKALANPPRFTSNINVLLHALGYFSKVISPAEKRFLLDSLEQYREGSVPLSVPLNLLRSYAVRFEEEYLKNQAYFEPYPNELVEITDSGLGRRLK